MASTAMEPDTSNGDESGGGRETSIQEIQDENVLREMWQDTEDPEEKRILRSRMYKLREDRIKEYYGREGHDILESILKPEVETGIEQYDEDGTDDGGKTIVEGNRELTVSSSESQSPDGTQYVKCSGYQVKQCVTTVTTSGDSNPIVDTSSVEKIKNRMSKKDRVSQFKEIRGAQEKSPRRKASSGEIEIINVKKASSTATSATSGKSRNATSIGTISTANNNNKVIANNIRNDTEHCNNGLSSVVQKRSKRGEGVTKVVNGKSSITSTSTTTMGGTKSSKMMTEGNKMTERGESQSSTTTTTVTRKSQSAASTTTTMKSSTTTTTSSFSSQSSSSVSRMITASGLKRETSNLGNMITSSSDGKSTSGTVVTTTDANDQIPIGSVQIEEIVEKPQEFTKLASGVRVTSGTTISSVGSKQKDFGNRIRQTKADADTINRNLANTNTPTVANAGATTTHATKSEMTKTLISTAKGCSRTSNANTSANGNTTNGSAIKDKSSKIVNKSRESSPKRSGKGVVVGGGPSGSPMTAPSGPGRGSKTSPKTGETSLTPTIKVDRVEDVGKADKSKTEESIIRELDILDTFLSQRSASIDEAAAKEETVLVANVNGTMATDHRKKVLGTDEHDNEERVDVMESGLEPPFTRKEYKYGCPGDDHDHHKSVERNTDEDKGKRGKAKPKSGRDVTTSSSRTRNDDTRKSNNFEDEIIVADKVTTTEIRSGKSEKKVSQEKNVRSLRQKEIKGNVTEKATAGNTSSTTTTIATLPSSSPNHLSSKGTRGKANNVKKPLAEEESFAVKATNAYNTGSTNKVSSRTTTTKDLLSKQQKYEADILSRPSVLQKKPVERPDPNPRIRKGSDSSPERESVKKVEKSRLEEKRIMLESDDNEEEDEDDLLKPHKVGKGLESPGAVLKAKSLFETKAQEAAMDRASADFDIDKGVSQMATVSKKAALFEARSRGERVSISSDSSASIVPEDNEQQPVDLKNDDNALKATSLVIASMANDPQTFGRKIRDGQEVINSDSKTTGTLLIDRKVEAMEKSKRSERENVRKSAQAKSVTTANALRKRSEEAVSRKLLETKAETVVDVKNIDSVQKGAAETLESVRGSKSSEVRSVRKSTDIKVVADDKRKDSLKSGNETVANVVDSSNRITGTAVEIQTKEVKSRIEEIREKRRNRERSAAEKRITRDDGRATEDKSLVRNEQTSSEYRLSREKQKQTVETGSIKNEMQREIPEKRLVQGERRRSREDEITQIDEKTVSRQNKQEQGRIEKVLTSRQEEQKNIKEKYASRQSHDKIAEEKRTTHSDLKLASGETERTLINRDVTTERRSSRAGTVERHSSRDEETERRSSQDLVAERRSSRDGAIERRSSRDGATERRSSRDGATERRSSRDGATERRSSRDRITERRSSRDGATERRSSRDRITERRSSRDGATERRTSRDGVTERRTSRDGVTERRSSRDRIAERRSSRDETAERHSSRDDQMQTIEERRQSREEARRVAENNRLSRAEHRKSVEERRKSREITEERRLPDRQRSFSRPSEEKRMPDRQRSFSRTTGESRYESTVSKSKPSLTPQSAPVSSSVSSNRMTTTELNAIDSMEDIEELERLLDRATDYDERSKIRGRIRALKRKFALVKKTSTEEDEALNGNQRSGSIQTETQDFKTSKFNGNARSTERRRSSIDLPPNKVTTRKKSSELPVNQSSLSHRSTSETRASTEVNTNTESGRTCRRTSRDKIVSKGESTSSGTVSKRIPNRQSSKSPSPNRKTSERKEREARRVSSERKLSSETQELLSTRRYSREKVKDEDEENKSPSGSNFSSRRNSKDAVTSISGATSSGTESPSKNLSRRSSREKISPTRTLESVPEVQKVIRESRQAMTKVEKYEADILSRPSVFQKKRQIEEPQESEPELVQRRTTRDSVSPQRSEIPISNRMKTARETNSPPKIIATDIPKPETSSLNISSEVLDTESVDKQISSEQSVITESTEVLSPAQPSKTGITKRVSSARTSSDEIRKPKTKSEDVKQSGGSRRDSGDQNSSVLKSQRRQSIEEGQQSQKTSSTGSSTTKKNTYTRKSSSKELNESLEQSRSSTLREEREPLNVPDAPKTTPSTEIDFNQQEQATKSVTQKTTVSSSPSPRSISNKEQQKTNNDSTTKGQQPSGLRPTTSSLTSSSTRRATNTNPPNKSSSLSSSSSSNNRFQGTETVTSSYGVGPTDDDGTPLFGLRALRKIKQVQEQISTTSGSSLESGKTIVTPTKDTSNDSNKSNLRSSENFGLRALKKGSAASRGFDETGESKSPVSSVPQGSTRESKSESVLSSSQASRKTTTTTSTIGTSGSPLSGGDGTKTTHTTMTTSEQIRGTSTSPKSILKKTSSFTSQSSGVVKSKTEEGNNLDQIGTFNNDRDELEKTGKNSDGSITISTKTSSSLTTSAIPSNNPDDFSWRRKSVSPSPDGQPQGGVSTVGTFSRGKVGRSSVKEMSRRFETSETTSSSTTSGSMSTASLIDHNNRTSFIRADSPSRIPSPIKTSTTITTKSSVEVKGSLPESTSSSCEVTHHNVDLGDQSDSDSATGLVRVTRKTVTKSSSGRSFLTDQSPIQNLTDVIERMKGEDDSRFSEDFKDDEDYDNLPTSDGRSLLNKFIGAQIIMQAVEPMLITQKVSMSSSLVINGVDVDSETNSAKLRQLLAEVDDGEDRERIENRLRNLESGSSEGVKGVERSSSSSSSTTRGSRPLVKTLSISGVQLGASDVTGELMPLILGQLQSSLDNNGASSSGSGIHIDTTQSDSSISSSHNSSNNNHNNSASTHNNTNSSSSSNEKSISGGSVDGDGGEVLEQSASAETVGSEECLFDSGTESGEDVANLSSPGGGGTANTSTSSAVQHAKSVSSPAEFSNFMEGLRNTLKRNQNKESLIRSYSQIDAFLGATAGEGESALGAGNISNSNIGTGGGSSNRNSRNNSIGDPSATELLSLPALEKEEKVEEILASDSPSEETNLVQQVDKVLTLLRDSLVKDPNCLKALGCADLLVNPDPEKGKELIALIDRLKFSLVASETTSGESDKQRESINDSEKQQEVQNRENSALPIGITENLDENDKRAEMLSWAQTRPPDIVPLPWVNHIQSSLVDGKSSSGLRKTSAGEDDVPWKVRSGRRRSHGRSHTVGVTQEELAEARRYLQEAAYRNAYEEQKQIGKEQEITSVEQTQNQLAPSESNDDLIMPSHDYEEIGKDDDEALVFEGHSPNAVDPVTPATNVVQDEQQQQNNNLVQQTMGSQSWQKDVEKGLTSIPRPFVKPGMYDSGYQPPPERRMTYASIDDSRSSILGSSIPTGGNATHAKIKPFRTFSLDNAYDPSKTLFTKEETVQIAIHQAAIKKQMSEEEDRRKRRNSLSSYNNIYSSAVAQPGRDFSLALPKPYSPPQNKNQDQQSQEQSNTRNNSGMGNIGGIISQGTYPIPPNQSAIDSGYTEESGSDSRQPRNDQLVLYESSQMSPISTNSPAASFIQLQQQQQSPSNTSGNNNNNMNNKRIENVQISLKELNSSEFPQLQIAITLNTNNGNGNNNHNNCNNNNSINESGQGNMQSQFHPSSHNSNSGNNNSGKQNNNNVNPGPNPDESTPKVLVGGGGSAGKAMRYKSKNERNRRLKRANTIDIPQPPGFLLSNDDDSEMEDEEDSDGNINNDSAKTVQFTYAPFKPKTDGDRKFLAFLEKNNALTDSRPVRPSYLGVNDKFWNNRFFNLKSSFESSSQGSSPSPSPILSPNRHPRSVSEMALTQGVNPSDIYTKPVWTMTDPGQLPQQVKNKLQVFETKSIEFQPKENPLRPSMSQSQMHSQNLYRGRPLPNQSNQRGPGQFVSSSSVYSTNTVRPQMMQDKNPSFENQNYDSNLVKRPVAMKGGIKVSAPASQNDNQSSRHVPKPSVSPLPGEGVHMIHATASALEAMKRSGFGPTAVVQPQRLSHNQQIHQPAPSQPPPIPPRTSTPQEKVELPWAKKEPLSLTNNRDPNAGRILMSKAKFEQLSQPEPVPMHPAVAHGQVVVPPPIPPKSIKSATPKGSNIMFDYHPRAPMQPGSRQSFPTASVPNVATLAGNYGQSSQFAPAAGMKTKLGTFGATQSFDEAYKRKLDQQPKVGKLQLQSEPRANVSYPEPRKAFGQVPQDSTSSISGTNNNSNRSVEFQRVPGSAFARKISVSDPPSRRSSGEEEAIPTGSRKSSIGGNKDGVMIQTPVVAKVMRGPQQQRAVVTSNRMSSINDEQQSSRLTNARSNIRNILNQYQAQGQSDSSDTSPPIMKANLQLSLPPLTKSMSGDALLQTHFRPTSLVVGPEELTFQQASPNTLKQYSPLSASTISPASLNVSPVAPSTITQVSPIRREPEPIRLQQKPHNPVIPKQRSLSEFPKIAPAPNIGILTIQTDLESLAKGNTNKAQPRPQQKQPNVPVQQKPTQHQQPQVHHQSKQQHVQQKPVPQPQPQPPKQQEQQSSPSSAPKVLKSYPATDSLQRTSSGSSIFNRAQSLFLSAQDGIPPATKARLKPPTLPKTHGVFPKQFEAQMSPDSANKKQREIEAYFRQQQQQQEQEQKAAAKAAAAAKGTNLRKSASHSKIMSRQRSISDGEEDVDQIFESLFKASAEANSQKSAEMSVASFSKSLDLSESKRMTMTKQHSTTSSSAFSSQVSSVAKVQSSNTVQSSSSSVGGGSGLNKFKQMDLQAKANSGGAPLFKFENPGLKASANSAKDILLYWCQCRTRDYENVKIENFSSSWSDGLAFCALIHHFFPDAFDYKSLDPRNRRYNFDLAFRIADEKAGIYPLLDTEDMIAMGRRPDWKCVFTYVQAMYRNLKELS